jgi:hypothetical protein
MIVSYPLSLYNYSVFHKCRVIRELCYLERYGKYKEVNVVSNVFLILVVGIYFA